MNKKIILLSTELAHFEFDDGTSRDMTKLDYTIKMLTDTDERIGYSVLTSYVNADAFDISKEYVGQTIDSTIDERPTKNGVKYVITSLAGIEI